MKIFSMQKKAIYYPRSTRPCLCFEEYFLIGLVPSSFKQLPERTKQLQSAARKN